MFDIQKLDEELKNHHLKRKDFAKKLGISRYTLFRRIYKEEGNFSLAEIRRMFEIFGKDETIIFLFGDYVVERNTNDTNE